MAKLSFILLATPMAFVGLTVPAAAEDDGERHSVIVRYSDLNLASVEGRERLATRVKSAVQRVCNSEAHNRQTLRERASALTCKTATMADADVKLAGLFNGDSARLADRGRIVVVAAP
ncbi:UrcA family protein [Sphingopyxis sp.]|uniref:UrcA family protein n=1 Tax=Sphingopyxis sp. TaxID=1908224 RepID=UPI002FC5FE2A